MPALRMHPALAAERAQQSPLMKPCLYALLLILAMNNGTRALSPKTGGKHRLPSEAATSTPQRLGMAAQAALKETPAIVAAATISAKMPIA